MAGLHVFMTVATAGNFTRAAAALGLTPAAVSLAIGQLEGELNVKLFNRSTRGVSLTEAGQHYWRQTEAAYRQVVHARDALRMRAASRAACCASPRCRWRARS